MVLLIAGASLGGCDTLARNNYFLPGGVDQRSAVAAQVRAAEQEHGPYPRFSQIPALPKDVRPLSAWRARVSQTLAEKRQVDAANAAYPYTLQDTQAFADTQHARIPATEAAPPSADAASASDAYAASVRARATKPPPPAN
ncbi:MAG TPA: hypothetical protein VHZ26_12320 [Caulobacteraceae bacterium]|jgi:hypothetical protein|nr:hypothetical protein [Caulobacteraceae bacterium]